jgi:hypothetical protein
VFIRQRTQSARLLRCSRMAVALALPSALHCQLTSSRCGAACRARDTALASERRARRSPPRMALAAPPRNFCSELEISLAFLLPRPEICAGPRAPRPAFPAMRAEKRRRRCEARLATQRRATFLGHRPAHSALGQRRDSPVPPRRGLHPLQSTRVLFPAQLVRSGLPSWYKRTEIYKNPGKRGRNSDFHPEILCFHFCTGDDRSAVPVHF